MSRRTAILDAGLASFLAHGVAGASIDDIRARSGASVGSVYHHFGGKEGLAAAVYVTALADYQAAFVATLRRHPGARDGVRATVLTHIGWCLREQPDLGRFLLFQGDAARMAASPELAERNRAFFATVLEWWHPHVAAGAVRDLAFAVQHALWLGGAQEYCRHQLAAPEVRSSAGAEQELADGAWRALGRVDGGAS